MDDKKKIVLATEDIISKNLDDIFINVNLQQSFSQIKKDKYDNNFDLAEQFRKERNQSRNFRIYGIVDSNIIDTDAYELYIYKDSGFTQLITTIYTTPLVYEERNIFDKKRGKYLIELDNYDSDVVYIKILGDNISYANQMFEQRLVYYTLDGDFVEYGSETVDIGVNNFGFLEIENNFPFFYNKHWIKKDIEIVETKRTIIQFNSNSSTIREGENIEIGVVMDKPSPFGNETAVLDATIGTLLPADFSLSISGTPVVFPMNLTWNQGEKDKIFKFDAITDDVIEFSETMYFSINDINFAVSGDVIEHYATIEDATPRNKTIYNLGEVYKNRAVFTGRTASNSPSSNTFETSAYSILRNGLKFGMKNEEFYPGDTYNVTIFNKGNDTILPINTELGITEEELFLSNSFKTFKVNTKYSGTDKHKIKLIFSSTTNHYGYVKINGVDIVPVSQTHLSFNGIKPRIDNSSSDFFLFKGIEKDWEAEFESTTAITITSTSPGLPVKVDFIGNTSNFYIEEITPFQEYIQIPKTITLYANYGVNNSLYNIQITKPNYEGLNIFEELQPASLVGENVYLISNLKNVSRSWDSLNNKCLAFTAATPDIGGPQTDSPADTGIPYTGIYYGMEPNYYWPVGDVYINGFVLNAKRNLPEYYSKTNFSSTLDIKFYPKPLLVLPCTNDDILQESIAQRVKITFPSLHKGDVHWNDLYRNYANSFRSFDFRTGTTEPYTTFYKSNPLFNQSYDIAWGRWIYTSGATNYSGTLSQILDYGYSSIIPSGPLLGLNVTTLNHLTPGDISNSFILESKTPGVPFEITNIVDAYVHTSAANTLLQYVVAGDYSAGAPITVEELIPNRISGVDINIVKNWMGGFNNTLQFAP